MTCGEGRSDGCVRNTGPPPRRPVFVSRVKPKVMVELFLASYLT